jgi:lysozyme family protein
MKDNFDRAFGFVIKHEGELNDDPNDPGGLTKYGISQRAYPDLDIRNITLDEAKTLYWVDYWNRCDCDYLAFPTDILVFDTAVNMGVSKAISIRSKASDFFDYVILRIHEYTKMRGFNAYGKGWINRVLNLYMQFKYEFEGRK